MDDGVSVVRIGSGGGLARSASSVTGSRPRREPIAKPLRRSKSQLPGSKFVTNITHGGSVTLVSLNEGQNSQAPGQFHPIGESHSDDYLTTDDARYKPLLSSSRLPSYSISSPLDHESLQSRTLRESTEVQVYTRAEPASLRSRYDNIGGMGSGVNRYVGAVLNGSFFRAATPFQGLARGPSASNPPVSTTLK